MINVPLSRPDIDERDIQSVINVLKTPYLSIGPKLTEFENKIANYVGRKFAIGVNSGTSALHLILKSIRE
jgi:perosamine synthetase